jgi:hypothetical protein
MNNTGGGVAQGRDMVLYNAFDWEHLRRKFMRLPGAPRSSLEAERKGSSKNMQKQMVTDLHAILSGNPEIQVEDLESVLYSKPGHEWHWTALGFQLAGKSKDSISRSRLSPSVENIRSAIRELGIREAYFPVGGQPLTMVLSLNIHPSIHRDTIY